MMLLPFGSFSPENPISQFVKADGGQGFNFHAFQELSKGKTQLMCCICAEQLFSNPFHVTRQHVCTSSTCVAWNKLPSIQHVVEEGVGRAMKEKGERVLAGKTWPSGNENRVAVLQPLRQQRDAVPLRCLSRCEEDGCNGLLRPHVVWFGEALDPGVLTAVEKELDICDLCLVVSGTFLTCPLSRQGGHTKEVAPHG